MGTKFSQIIHCPKSIPTFRNVQTVTWNVVLVENMILHEIIRIVSRFPRTCYIAENQFPVDSVERNGRQFMKSHVFKTVVIHMQRNISLVF